VKKVEKAKDMVNGETGETLGAGEKAQKPENAKNVYRRPKSIFELREQFKQLQKSLDYNINKWYDKNREAYFLLNSLQNYLIDAINCDNIVCKNWDDPLQIAYGFAMDIDHLAYLLNDFTIMNIAAEIYNLIYKYFWGLR
jgi:hypothetical protein